MEFLWAPWRMEYILSDKEDRCFICDAAQEGPSENNLLLHRGDKALVLMNRYPYNNGHLLVAPVAHTSDLSDLTFEEYQETMELFRFSFGVLGKLLSPEGYNAGINLGKTGGAGLEEHLHFHIVPRWNGDTNFMPVVSNTRVIPEALIETYRAIRPLFDGYCIKE